MISIAPASLSVMMVVPLAALAWSWLSAPVPREDHAFRAGHPPVPAVDPVPAPAGAVAA